MGVMKALTLNAQQRGREQTRPLYWDKGALSSDKVLELAGKIAAERGGREKAKADRHAQREKRQQQRQEETLMLSQEAMDLIMPEGEDPESRGLKPLTVILSARSIKPAGRKAEVVQQMKDKIWVVLPAPVPVPVPQPAPAGGSGAHDASDSESDELDLSSCASDEFFPKEN